jgi:endonuclease YncB( thermonuclease family)
MRKLIRIKRSRKGANYLLLLLAILVLFGGRLACINEQTKPVAQDDKTQTETPVKKLAENEYFLKKIVDGDTIQVLDLKESVRLLCVDTEETFKPNDGYDSDLAYNNWDEYLKVYQKDDSILKYPTPWGEDASKFAEDFFQDVETVFLETDSETRLTDFFDRYLRYVIVEKNGKLVNFNVQLVQLGYTPYYAKYGYSKKYHKEFLEAEKYARENKLGIWTDEGKHYPDYAQRTKWWNERGDSISFFENNFADNPEYVMIIDEQDWKNLETQLGRKLTLFGTIDHFNKKGPPYRLLMTYKVGRSLLLLTDSRDIFHKLTGISGDESCVYVEGVLEKNRGGYYVKIENPKAVISASEMQKKLNTR